MLLACQTLDENETIDVQLAIVLRPDARKAVGEICKRRAIIDRLLYTHFLLAGWPSPARYI